MPCPSQQNTYRINTLINIPLCTSPLCSPLLSSPVLSLSYYPASADILSRPIRLASLQDGDERMIQIQKEEHESLHFLLVHAIRGRKREDAPGALIDSGDLIGFISQDVGPREEAPSSRRSPPHLHSQSSEGESLRNCFPSIFCVIVRWILRDY